MAEKSGAKLFRLRIPDGDTQVLEWLASQEHASISLRLLIKEDIARQGGIVDVLDRDIFSGESAGKKKRSAKPVPVREAVKPAPSVSPEPKETVREAAPVEKESRPVREESAKKQDTGSVKTDGGTMDGIKSLLSGSGRGVPSAASMGLVEDDD